MGVGIFNRSLTKSSDAKTVKNPSIRDTLMVSLQPRQPFDLDSSLAVGTFLFIAFLRIGITTYDKTLY